MYRNATQSHFRPLGFGAPRPRQGRVIVRNAETGAVIASYGGASRASASGAMACIVEHEIAAPTGSVVVLATGKGMDGVARAVANTLSVKPEDVAARLLALPAIAAWDLDEARARRVAAAVQSAGGRAVVV
jgi:hypothetical protein